jgi:hypothetical protein
MIPQKSFKFSPILFPTKTEQAIEILSSVFDENEISFSIYKNSAEAYIVHDFGFHSAEEYPEFSVKIETVSKVFEALKIPYNFGFLSHGE